MLTEKLGLFGQEDNLLKVEASFGAAAVFPSKSFVRFGGLHIFVKELIHLFGCKRVALDVHPQILDDGLGSCALLDERLTGPDEIPWIPHFARQETRDVAGTVSQGIGQEGRVGFVVAGLGLVAGDRRRIGNQQVPASLFEQIVHPVLVVGGFDDGDVLLSLTEPRHEIDVLLLPFPKSDAAGSHDLAAARAIFPDLVDHYREVDVVAVQVLSDEVNRVVKAGVVGLNGLKGVSIHESLPLMLSRKNNHTSRLSLCLLLGEGH